jgi:ABC-type transport system involved in multi-copper enzyme maturation permease subunit
MTMSTTVVGRMIGAEVLKLRRNRGVMAFAALLSVGVVVLAFGFTAVEHASDPKTYAPAGGIDGFSRAVKMLGLYFGALTGILIGAEAGTADISSGVFRDLVATGRSRLTLFFVRLPAAIAVSFAFVGCAFVLAILGTFAFAGGTPTPDAGLVAQSAGWIALGNALVVALAVGIGSLTGSRAVALTAVIGWQAVATQLLLNVSALGSARDGLLTASLGQLMPVSGRVAELRVATGVAVPVLLAWAIVPTALGAWCTKARDA